VDAAKRTTIIRFCFVGIYAVRRIFHNLHILLLHLPRFYNSMRTDIAPTIHRRDYQPFPWRIPHTHLLVELDARTTRVHSTLQVEAVDGQSETPLVLNGEQLALQTVTFNGRTLTPDEYQLAEHTLTLHLPAAGGRLEITGTCSPQANSMLMGLYVSGNSLFTQCEAEGFRRITWFADRPDVMSCYRVTLQADKARYPVLLSNGNLLGTRDLPGGRHEAVWHDPFPKPSYLFALVAGQFDCCETTVHTRSGRQVLLQIYSDPGTRDKTQWALQCLERALKWDETRFGLELDLDRFMIVAARDFNMGAMENKGLNVFNSSYILADADSATDASFEAIESVIGHEYFHNWTGNRVTCRDWFQLSLKEGLTVFRDQEFSADMMAAGLNPQAAASARAVKRIDDVTALRVAQFPEDAGPMAHPIRPDSYQEIGNFYTATVYEKGAEVIRMLHTLLGEDTFQAGMREYFRRHDGQAVTCDDFVNAMQAAGQAQGRIRNLDIFRRWYEQAGTPQVSVSLSFEPQARRCTLTLTQSNPPAGLEKQQTGLHKPALHIPFALGLLNPDGQPIRLPGSEARDDTLMLELTEAEQCWTFDNIPEGAVPSLLHGFSAPVRVHYAYSDAQLALLSQKSTDPFARWEAGQMLAARQMLALAENPEASIQTLQDTWQSLLSDAQLTPAYRARALTLPAEKVVLADMQPMHPRKLAQVRQALRQQLGAALAQDWLRIYEQIAKAQAAEPYQPDAPGAGKRALKNLALSYLAAARHPQALALAHTQYAQANNLTDRLAALNALLQGQDGEADTVAGQAALDDFYQRWQHDPLIIDRWFSVQATAAATGVADVRRLMQHPSFTLRTPNRVRALVFQFCQNNLLNVHQPEGYDFWAAQVLALDAINPEIAARLARAFDNWAQYAPDLREAVKASLVRISQHAGLSKNTAEIIHKALLL